MPLAPRSLAALAIVGLISACSSGNAAPANVSTTRTLHKSIDMADGATLSVENLAGHVTVKQGGDKPSLRADVMAAGKNKAAAEKLADSISLDTEHDGDDVTVHVDYPVDAHSSFRYVRDRDETDQSGVLTQLFGKGRSSLDYQDTQVKVYRGSTHGVPLHVNLVVKLPEDANVAIDNGVGSVKANHLMGNVQLDNTLGKVDVADIQGNLRIRATSGDVHVDAVDGDVNVKATNGNIDGKDIHGKQVTVQSTNGNVQLQDASGHFKVATTNGKITLEDASPNGMLHAESTNGDISIDGDLSAASDLDVGTTMGNVRIATHKPPQAHLNIDTSMGGINVTWPDLQHVDAGDNHYSADVGSAEGTAGIETTMGDVTLTD